MGKKRFGSLFNMCSKGSKERPEKMSHWPAIPDTVDTTPPDLPEGTDYHVFVCECTENVRITDELKETLRHHGYKCPDILPGDFVPEKISEGIKASKVVITVVTAQMSKQNEDKDARAANWTPFEMVNTIAKSTGGDKILFIPILHGVEPNDVPIYIKEMPYLQVKQDYFWAKLFDMMNNPKSRREVLPSGNIGHGLCWSHYNGYLALVLPSLPDRVRNYELYYAPKKWGDKAEKIPDEIVQEWKALPILPKLVTVVPISGKCPKDFVDKNIKHLGLLRKSASRGGKNYRDYDSNLKQITDPATGKRYLAPVEYPAAISIMPEMEHSWSTDFSVQHREKQLKLFTEKIREIVKHKNNRACNNTALFVEYQDDVEDPERLSSVLARVISNDPDLITPQA